jgi:hypothetical protein
MKSRRIVVAVIIAALTLSCSLPFFAGQGGGPPPVPSSGPGATQAPQAAPPTDTVPPPPTETATITLTPTPGVPMVTPIDQPVNCRFGPGTDYEAQGRGLAVGNSAQILGKSEDGEWWQVQDPSSPNQTCWLAASVTNASGNLSAVAVIAAPAAFVTDASIQASPSTIHVPGCSFPGPSVGFTWTIQVNGPTVVKYHLEALGDVSSTDSVTFTKFGSKTLSDHHNIGAVGDYTVKLVITSPNKMTASDSFKVVCP